MNDGIPISEQVLIPEVERGAPVGYPLGPEHVALAADMSARILAGVVAATPAEYTPQQAAVMAVEMAMHVFNEVRKYRLVDNKVVKV